MNRRDKHKVKESVIEGANISDHSSLVLKLNLISSQLSTLWRLNAVGMQNHKTFNHETIQDIRRCIDDNDNRGKSFNVWDAHLSEGKLYLKQ